MKIFVTDDFDRFMGQANLSDELIAKVAKEIDAGLHDGNLDMGVLLKKRIASPKQSKSNSNRSIVAVKKGEKIFFIAGWRKADIPKKGKEIPDNLMETYKLLGESFRNFTDNQIQDFITDGNLREINNV